MSDENKKVVALAIPPRTPKQHVIRYPKREYPYG